MIKKFKKLMREQIESSLSEHIELVNKEAPKKGWIRTIREALGMSSYALAARLGCTRVNLNALEKREAKDAISLKTLKQVAEALNCKLVYVLVPNESFDITLEKQARLIAKKRIATINHSMTLEQQGLNQNQLKQQEEDLVQELLQGDPKNLWITMEMADSLV
jgi:predicted DNA-binding mobile mystery protein A